MDARIRKFENYKHMKASLKRAMNEEFYYQAIFIEYAIIEDRTASVLRHAGVKSIDNRGWELKLSAKLNNSDHIRDLQIHSFEKDYHLNCLMR